MPFSLSKFSMEPTLLGGKKAIPLALLQPPNKINVTGEGPEAFTGAIGFEGGPLCDKLCGIGVEESEDGVELWRVRLQYDEEYGKDEVLLRKRFAEGSLRVIAGLTDLGVATSRTRSLLGCLITIADGTAKLVTLLACTTGMLVVEGDVGRLGAGESAA